MKKTCFIGSHHFRFAFVLLALMMGLGTALNAAPPQSYNFWVERSNGANGQNFTTLSAAVASINDRAYACNLYINEDCTLNEAITFTNTQNFAVTIYGNNHTITRGSGVVGDLITYNRTTTRALIIYDLTLDGANVSAAGSLLKIGTSVQLTLSNFTAINHTASANGVCAVDASAAGAANYVQLNTAKIIGNTANGKPANLKIPGDATYTRFNTSLTDDIGITTTNSELNTDFARWYDANNTGWEHLKNDVLESNGTPYRAFYSGSGRVRWISAENNFYVEQTNGANGESFSTLSAAVASINGRNYNCNLHIFEDCTLNEAITITNTNNTRTVTIFGNGHTVTRGSGAMADLITYQRNAALTINNLTLDGANVSATGALLYLTGTGALTVSDSEFKGSTTASTGSLISKSVSNNSSDFIFTNTVFTGNATTGTLLSFLQSSGSRTMNISFNNCTINGASSGNGNLVSHTTANGSFVAINTTFTRNQSTGYGCYITGTGAVTFTDCTFDGSNTTAATQPLIKSGTGTLTLTNTTVKNHTVSAANVCAVEASSASSVNLGGSTKITGNTSNSVRANLNVPSDKSKTVITATITETIGITTSNYALNSEFATWSGTTNFGWNHLKNDKLDQAGTNYYVYRNASNGGTVSWKDVSGANTPTQIDDMFGHPSITYPLKTAPTTEDMTLVPAGAISGLENNDITNPNMVWKSVSYNDADHSVDIIFNYFQRQVNLKMDLIFVIDETGTMDGLVTANGYTQSQAWWARYASVRAAKGALDLNSSINPEYADCNNDNRAKIISWSTNRRMECDFTSDYEELVTFAQSYETISGATDPSYAVTYAREAVAQSRSEGRLPIVIWMSDMHVMNNTTMENAPLLRAEAEAVYAIMVFEEHPETYKPNMKLLTPEAYHYFADNSNAANLVNPIIQVIKDAIERCDSGLHIEDELDAVTAAGADANGITSTDDPVNVVTYGATYNDLSNTISWAMLTDDPALLDDENNTQDIRLLTGKMYKKVVNIKLSDDVYSGNATTNLHLSVMNEDMVVNQIDAADSPIVKNSIILVLKGGDSNGAPLAGATFQMSKGRLSWTLTTDGDGQIVLPWGENDGTNTFAFNADDEYTLSQTATIDGYVLPGGSWTLSVGSDYKITSTTTQGTGNVNRTRDMVAVSGMFEIYNDSEPTLTYVPNGGDGNQIEVTIDFENYETSHDYTTLTAAESGFTFGDRTLVGWNTLGDGSGTSYGLGANITLSHGENGNISLYAQWSGDPIIARVWDGTQWTMHSYLINSSGTGTNQGAFDYANTLSGDVIIETLLETAIIGGADRYTLDQGFTFNNAEITSLTLRTTQDAQWNPATDSFTSIITKNQTTKSMISVTSAIPSLVVENLIFDGGGDNGSCGKDGGIFNVASDEAIFTDCDFQHSIVVGNCNGGAICYANPEHCTGSVALYGCVFNDCQAPTGTTIDHGNGGGFYVRQAGSVIVDESATRRSSFTDCIANRYGGAVMFEDNDGSTLLVEHTDFDGCQANTQGGGAVFSDANDATTIDDCTFTDCSASTTSNYGCGGAIATNLDTNSSNGTNSVSNCTFTRCSAKLGGAICSYSSEAVFNIADCTFEGCQASSNGGAIYAAGDVNLLRYEATFMGCTATQNGGAIYAKGDVNLSEDIMLTLGGTQTGEGCSAGTGNGGGVYCDGDFYAPQGTYFEVTSCTAKNLGGGICVSGELYFYGHATFTGCTANTDGGGVYAYSGLEIDGDATFTNCTATRNGGGIYTPQSCLLTHQYNPSNPSLTLVNCHAGTSGGGAYFINGIHTTWDASSSSINPATITATGCTAGVDGGGFYLRGGVDLYGDPYTTGCYITGCSAGTGKGGGIYLNCASNFAGLIIVEGNTHGTDDNTVADDVYINYQSAEYINIDVVYGLDCASHIGIYKDEGYYADANGIYSTEIAEGTEEHCQQAVNGKLLFDDRNLYGTFHFDYIGTNPQNDFLTYALGKVYFVPSWEAQAALAVENTDYKLADGYVSEVLTNRGMAFLAKDVNLGGKDYEGKTVALKDNIDLGGSYWTPISSSTRAATDCNAVVPETRFKGTFNGNGYVISNLLSILPYQHMGLFGYVEGGTITNTFVHGGYLENTHIPSSYYGGSTTGGLVGYLDGQGTVTYCEAALRLNGENPNYAWPATGGLVGYVDYQSTIHSSMAMPEIVSEHASNYNGGLVGELLDGSVINCFAYPKFDVVCESWATLGGLIGASEEDVTVSNCYVRMQEGSSMTGEYNFGMLDGGPDDGNLNHCYIPTGESYFCCESTRVPTESGEFSPTALVSGKYGYGHSDQLVDETPLVDLLNDWVEDNDGQGYARWSRTMASPMNGDYPVLLLPGSVCITSTDTVFLAYHSEVNDQIKNLNGTEGGGFIYLYEANPTAINTNTDEDVCVYIHEDVGITQSNSNKLNVRVGVTLDNSKHDAGLWGKPYDWHMFSSALKAAPLGLEYHTTEAGYEGVSNYALKDKLADDASLYVEPSVYANANGEMDPPKTTFNTTDAIGYFPTDSPYGPWRGVSPASPYNGDDGFDFYCYSEEYRHWVNFKREGTTTTMDHWHQNAATDGNHYKIQYYNDNNSVLKPGKGYMAAVGRASMLMADGELNNGNVDMPAQWSEGNTTSEGMLSGMNLIGNPYQSYLDFDRFTGSADGWTSPNDGKISDNTYYTVDADKSGYVAYLNDGSDNEEYASRYIHPHQGFFVRVSSAQTLKFTNGMRVAGNWKTSGSDEGLSNSYFRGDRPNYLLVNLMCYDGNGRRDLTTVEVGRPELGGAHKMYGLRMGDGLLFAHLGDESYQALFAPDSIEEVPVRFKAFKEGVFTMKWSVYNGEFSYLHLLDHKTGMDIDCLSSLEYVFEGSPEDYLSRFVLKFRRSGSAVEEYDSDTNGESGVTFAFMHDGQLVVNGEGRVDLYDIQGRLLESVRVSGDQNRVAVPSLASGVYLLRLISQGNVRVQKIVINKR